MKKWLVLILIGVVGLLRSNLMAGSLEHLSFDPEAALQAIPLALEGAGVFARVEQRVAQHLEELKRKGLTEMPASRAAVSFDIGMGLLGSLYFDEWDELVVDRRFMTKEDLAVIRKIEDFVRQHVIEPLRTAQALPNRPASTPKRLPPRRRERKAAGAAPGLPIFRGFEDARYQQHDALIAKLVAEFNANREAATGGTAAQVAKVSPLTPALVKAHMIEETGGNGPASRAAWPIDPIQVNVPGDWGEEKRLVGLTRPTKRNEGTAEVNVRAAIRYLSRKGFGVSARPAAERPSGFFDGWQKALERYNGRRDRTASDQYYGEEYASKIMRRAENPDLFVPIEIKLAPAGNP